MKKSIGIVAALMFLLMTGCSTAESVVQESSGSEYEIAENNPTAQADRTPEIVSPAGETESSTTHTGSTDTGRQEPEPTGSKEAWKPLESSSAVPSADPPRQDRPGFSQTNPPTSSVNRLAKTEKPADKSPTPPAEEAPVTSVPSVPAESSTPSKPAQPTKPTEPAYTEADFDRIIRETVAYAESYREKGFTFEWLDSMEFGWDVGYMGTPRIKYEGVEGIISRLKGHIDKIVETNTNPAYGVTSDRMTYKVVQITVDGDIAFAVIYGG